MKSGHAPRTTLKGEEPLQLRLMDDIVIRKTLAYGSFKPDRPPYATDPPEPRTFGQLQHSKSGTVPADYVAPAREARSADALASPSTPRITAIVLKSEEVFHVIKFRVDGSVLSFEQVNGTTGAVDLQDVDWRKSEMTALLKSGAFPPADNH